jgi:hypothetical protein
VAPGGLTTLFAAAGLRDVEEQPLAIRMEPASFDDFWDPYAGGEGPIGAYVSALSPDVLAQIQARVRDAYLAGRGDGPRSYVAVAWSCRGVVPRD